MVNHVKGPMVVLRLILAINFFRLGLSFFPSFEGTAYGPGLIDTIFPAGNGFRPDFLWLILSTICIGIAFLVLVYNQQLRTQYRIETVASGLWIIAFVGYVARALMAGLLYFG